MTGIVDVPTGDRPAAIQRFQAIHDPRKIFDDGQITSGQLAQHTHAGLAMVDRFEIIETQQFGELAGIDPVTFVPVFQQSVLAWIADYDFGNEQPTPKGRPFIMRFRQLSDSRITNQVRRALRIPNSGKIKNLMCNVKTRKAEYLLSEGAEQ